MKQMNTPPFVKLCSFAFALTLLAGGQARATDYYITPAGSDANDGTTPNQAWQTIERAHKATLRPGDRILFEGGRRFSGNLLITASGTKEAFIEIGSYGNGPATIQAGDSYGIRLLNCQYVKVRDLILAGSGVKPDGQTTNKGQGLDMTLSSLIPGPAPCRTTVTGASMAICAWLVVPVLQIGERNQARRCSTGPRSGFRSIRGCGRPAAGETSTMRPVGRRSTPTTCCRPRR